MKGDEITMKEDDDMGLLFTAIILFIFLIIIYLIYQYFAYGRIIWN